MLGTIPESYFEPERHGCITGRMILRRIFTLLLLVVPFTLAQNPPSATGNVYPMDEGFVDANGVMIYYKTVGRGEPLMIVHGGPGASHDYFLPNLYPAGAPQSAGLHRRAWVREVAQAG